MRNIVAFLCLLFAPHVASAQVVKITMPVQGKVCTPFFCKPVTQEGIGAGVIIGRSTNASGDSTYRILTVYHLTGNKPHQWLRRNHNYQLTVHTRVGRFPAKIVSYNGEMLLMLLSIEVPAGAAEMPCLPVADVLPNAGDPVSIYGFAFRRNGEYGGRSVILRSIDAGIFTVMSPFDQGESGGPLVKNGQIVGLCEGYYDDDKTGFGPSVIAIRRFLDLPAIGSRPAGRHSEGTPERPAVPNQAGVPVRPGVPVRADVSVPGGQLPVQPKPTDTGSDAGSGGDHPSDGAAGVGEAPPFVAGSGVGGYRQVDTPQPGTITSPVGSAGQGSQTETPATGDARSLVSGNRSGTAESIKRAAVFGMDAWSMLAGVGLVAGTGGLGGLALLAWRGYKGLKALKAATALRRSWQDEPRPGPPPPPPRRTTGATVASVVPPIVPLDPQNVNFVEVPTDYRRASVDYALAETGRRYPGAIATLEVVKSLINQHLAGTGHGADTLHP